jgi:hypothetical protein
VIRRLLSISCPLALAIIPLATLSAADLHFDTPTLTATPAAGAREVPFAFPFTNRSTRTITVTEVKPTCGCTVATLERRVFTPGEGGVVTVVFTGSGTDSGLQQKRVHVLTDDPDEADIVLTVEVVLPEGPTIDHRFLTWDRGGALSTQVVTVRIPERLPLSVTEAVDHRQLFAVELRRTDDPKVVTVAVTPHQTDRPSVGDVTIAFSGGQVLHVFVQVRQPAEAVHQP